MQTLDGRAGPQPTGSSPAPAVELLGVSKNFGNVQALDDVTLNLYSAQIHCLAGENGAGKSTLIRILTGAIDRSAGDLQVFGESIPDQPNPLAQRRRGIGVVYQELSLFPQLTVLDNLLMGSFSNRGGLLSGPQNTEKAREYLERVGLADLPLTTEVGDLPTATRQLVEIARVLGNDAKFVIFDEPTTALSEREAAELMERVVGLRDQGLGVLYVTHRIEEMFQIGDQISVLRDGQLVDSRPVKGFTPDTLVESMVGRPLAQLYPGKRPEPGNTILETKDLLVDGFTRPVNISVRAGEIVGVAGLLGSGRTEILRAIFGADAIDGGTVEVDGKTVDTSSPAHSARSGIGFLTEDRKESGALADLTIRENIAIAGYRQLAKAGWLSAKSIDDYVDHAMVGLSVKYDSLDDEITSLSGGNQQKVLILRWLATGAKVLLLDEPTKGIDVGAKADIYQAISNLAEQGIGFLVVSSYLPELLGLCDRIIVVKDHAVVADVPAATSTEESIIRLASIDTAHAFAQSAHTVEEKK